MGRSDGEIQIRQTAFRFQAWTESNEPESGYSDHAFGEKKSDRETGIPVKGQFERRHRKPMSDLEKVLGMVERGNIVNLYDRPILKNPRGGYSTTSSFSFGEDGKEVLIPTVIEGVRYTPKEAWKIYRRTGQHLGKFRSIPEANWYANHLHKAQAGIVDALGGQQYFDDGEEPR